MDIDASYNFRRVGEKLTTSGLVRKAGLGNLASQGYEVVINLLPDSSEYAVPGEREIMASQGIEYIYIPVDFKHPTVADFEQFSQALDRVLERKVHVHCGANFRVSVFYALYEVRRRRWNVAQAMEFVRGIWNPDEHPGWPQLMADILGAESNSPGDHR